MNSLDIGILSIASIFFIRGLFRGFVFELVTVIGLILGYIISITYLSIVSAFILSHFPTFPDSVVNIVSFLVLFVGTNLLLRLVANLLTKTLQIAMLGWLNRLLGGIFGMVKCLIVLSIFVFLIDLMPFASVFLEKINASDSYLYPVLEILGPRLYEQIKQITSILF